MPSIAVAQTYGVADPVAGVELFTNYRGQTYVGAYWGPWRIYANLPAEAVTVVFVPEDVTA